MKVVTIHVAKTNLSQLIAQAQAGEEIILARGKEHVAKIVPIRKRGKRKFGALRGKGSVGPEFFEPLPKAELKLWE
jgi:antitoxin (DNA-binding transcriptional repressor) of toxin-antitoxin stability system